MTDDSGAPKSVQEMRGMPAVDRNRERPYSAKSYAAQYGITVDEAEGLLARSTSHPQMHRQILAMFRDDEDLKRRALLLEDETKLTEEERKSQAALLERAGLRGPARTVPRPHASLGRDDE